MKNINKSELLAILTNDRQSRINFALEIESANANNSENCIFKFKEAFTPDSCESSNSAEFMVVFCETESDREEEYNISLNALCGSFIDECCERIQRIINSGEVSEIKLIVHKTIDTGISISKLDSLGFTGGELIHSFCFDAESKDINTPETAENPAINIRMLSIDDEILCEAFENDSGDYFTNIFDYSIRSPKYKDCGIIGGFDSNGKIIGYLSYYGLDETLRDVSYIYVGANYRNKGHGKALLNFFKNKNISEKKISYYSYPENEYSEKLAESCGFFPCAYRYEYEI